METKYIINGDKFVLSDNKDTKSVRSENYNYNFNKTSGRFERWGKTEADDPDFSPAPEILDIEVTTICNGVPNKDGVKSPCKFCYKSNTPNGKNMSLDTFRKVIDRFPQAKQKYVEVELDNKEVVCVFPGSLIKLTNGEVITALDIKDGDDISHFL